MDYADKTVSILEYKDHCPDYLSANHPLLQTNQIILSGGQCEYLVFDKDVQGSILTFDSNVLTNWSKTDIDEPTDTLVEEILYMAFDICTKHHTKQPIGIKTLLESKKP